MSPEAAKIDPCAEERLSLYHGIITEMIKV
jgi:hypothetical protein